MTTEIIPSRQKRRSFKNVFIYPEFQIEFILWMFGILFLTILIVGCGSLLWLMDMKSAGLKMNLPESHPYFILLDNFSTSYIKILVSALGVSAVLCIAIGLNLSHRISGPLVRLRSHLLKVKPESELKLRNQNLTFRKKDFFKDLYEAYNQSLK